VTETVARLDRRLAEQFLARHLQLLGGDEISGFRFHRAVARRFLAGLCRFDAQVGTEQLVLSDERLLAWLTQEARRRTTASAGVCFLYVSRYVDGLVDAGLLRGNPLADFQARHGGRGWPVLAAALRSTDPGAALLLLQPRPEKPGPIRPHVERYLELHQATGKDFRPNKSLLIHLDRFLGAQGIPSPCGITTEAMGCWANAIGGNARTRFKKVRMAWNFFGYLLDLKVLTANPIGLVVVAIAALIAGVILAYQHFDGDWRFFALLFFVPDVSILPYFVSTQAGWATYNTVHCYLWPALLAWTIRPPAATRNTARTSGKNRLMELIPKAVTH
jgi:hypothetical protein